MTSQDIQKALDPNKISCPRCFHIYKRAQKLFKNISSLAEKETIGICDHCATQQQKHSTARSAGNRSQCKCKNVITRFLTSEKKLDLALAVDAITKPWQSDKSKQRPILASRQYHSDENVRKDMPCQKDKLEEKTFSFVFPKEKEVEPSHQISSSQLITDLRERDDRNKDAKKNYHKKSDLEKEEEKIKSSKDSTPKSEKDVKEIKDIEKLRKQKEEAKNFEKQKLQKEANDIGTPKSQKETKGVDVETSKSQKEKETKDIESHQSQKEKEFKEAETSKSPKEKNIKNAEKLKSQKDKQHKDVDKPKPQKEEKTKEVEKAIPQKETKNDTKPEKESSKKNDDADNLLKQLLSSGDKAKAESERKKREQELASQKAKQLAEQKLKELTTQPPVGLKIKAHKVIKSNESDLQLEKESSIIALEDKKPDEAIHIIVGQKLFKNTTFQVSAPEQEGKLPLFFKSAFQEEAISEEPKPTTAAKKPQKEIMAAENRQGVIHYALSDRTFIDKGWTKLPTEKVVRKMNVYRMRPAHPEFDWFEHNKNRREMLYDSGQKLAEFSDDGRGRWYYRNGRLALDYYNAEETNAQQRYVVYSNGEPDERGRSRPRTVLATFDYLGNGVVFDHSGKIRLKYNQTEGVLLDRSIGPVSHWKWHDLNDPPVLQQVMVDTQVERKDPRIYKINPGTGESNRIRPPKHDEDMLAIEFNNFIKEKSKKLSKNFQPYQIKMKALKINENFSLKILDQASVYLIFRDGLSNMKVNMGMILDNKEIVDTDTADVGDVSNSMERFPARTDSLAVLQQAVAQAQRSAHLRVRHEQRLHKPTGSLATVDRLKAAASRPPQPPLMTNSKASISGPVCKCTIRKPTLNVYYDNRISS